MKRYLLLSTFLLCFGVVIAQKKSVGQQTAKEPTAEELYLKAWDYIQGKKGLPVDTTKAIELWMKSAEKGNAKAQYELGFQYGEGMVITKNYEQSTYWYRKAAEQGDPKSQFQLSHIYETGKGVVKDNEQAVYWCRLAAEQGYSIAQAFLGDYYYEGIGVEMNFKQAIYWYHKATEQNDAYAFYGLFRIYCHGKGVDRNVNEAVKWLKKGAELGNAECQWLLGFNYYTDVNGLGLPKDGLLAVHWLEKAVLQNHDAAMEVLADMYDEGELVKRDKQKSNELYQRAAELGNSEAAYKLATAYGFGDGVDMNKEAAFKWMKKAAELGYAKAQLDLGYFFATGYACEKDETAAGYWWRLVLKNKKASENERVGAQKNIDLLDE